MKYMAQSTWLGVLYHASDDGCLRKADVAAFSVELQTLDPSPVCRALSRCGWLKRVRLKDGWLIRSELLTG